MTNADHKVDFPPGGDETDDTMAARVIQFVAGMLRPGEWLRGVQTINSVLERKYLAIDLNDVKNGLLPEGASQDLIQALQETINTGILPAASDPQPSRSQTIDTTIAAEQLILGGDQHLERFEHIVGEAQSDIFVLSTFVASESDAKIYGTPRTCPESARTGMSTRRALPPILRDDARRREKKRDRHARVECSALFGEARARLCAYAA